ncbi:hypothetical protein EIK79_06700 [Halocatena pleomorpha]|uniref:DUF4013 domain-containing protein n=2 Tax=Halocatena pleomorpha TaxID=1785090 RepID=A0A3P3RG45_9EURY|nr:hypothetical protein EIK79_06700 [Halocatena pleomorpha]
MPVTVLREAGSRIRHDPALVGPFAVAGLFVMLADLLREFDPIPVATPVSFGHTFSIQYSIVPKGTARTIRHINALFDLRDPYLLGAVALELLVLLAVGLAGWLTITRALRVERRLDSLARYIGFLFVVTLLFRIMDFQTITVGSLLLFILMVLAAFLVLIRLFFLPGLLVRGCRYTTALQKSIRTAVGERWTLFCLIIVFGFASWGLAQVPIVGGGLSTVVVAPIHAVSIAVLLDRNSAVIVRADSRSG